MTSLASSPGQGKDLLGGERVRRLCVVLASLLDTADRVCRQRERVRPTRVLEHVRERLAVRVDIPRSETGTVEPAQETLDLRSGDLGQPAISEGPHDASEPLAAVARPRSWRRQDRVVIAQRRRFQALRVLGVLPPRGHRIGERGRAVRTSRGELALGLVNQRRPLPARPLADRDNPRERDRGAGASRRPGRAPSRLAQAAGSTAARSSRATWRPRRRWRTHHPSRLGTGSLRPACRARPRRAV